MRSSLPRLNLQFFPLLLAMLILVGCNNGVEFASVIPNLALPHAYTTRSVYESGVAAYDFYDLTGNILIIKKDNSEPPLRAAIIRPAGYKDSVRMLSENESLNYYHSIITKGANVQGTYLAFAAQFTDDQVAEYTLMDVAQSSIRLTPASFNEIGDSLRVWVRNHPRTDTSKRRIWIKSVVLSSSLYTAGNKIKANASGVVGNTFGVNGSVYNTNSQTIKGTIIGFDYFDIDEWVSATASRSSLADVLKDLDASKVALTVSGKPQEKIF